MEQSTDITSAVEMPEQGLIVSNVTQGAECERGGAVVLFEDSEGIDDETMDLLFRLKERLEATSDPTAYQRGIEEGMRRATLALAAATDGDQAEPNEQPPTFAELVAASLRALLAFGGDMSRRDAEAILSGWARTHGVLWGTGHAPTPELRSAVLRGFPDRDDDAVVTAFRVGRQIGERSIGRSDLDKAERIQRRLEAAEQFENLTDAYLCGLVDGASALADGAVRIGSYPSGRIVYTCAGGPQSAELLPDAAPTAEADRG